MLVHAFACNYKDADARVFVCSNEDTGLRVHACNDKDAGVYVCLRVTMKMQVCACIGV